MVEIIDLGRGYYQPPLFKGLEKIVLFADSEFKTEGIPNSSIWVFDGFHPYVPEILSDDVGCGMALFMTSKEIDPFVAADRFYDHLSGKRILGRGNHFIDVCGSLETAAGVGQGYNFILIHSDGKSFDPSVPKTVEEAKIKQKNAESFRSKLGDELARLMGVEFKMICDYTHNSVEADNKVIYRKGVIKIVPEKIHPLPAHLGSKILVYTTHDGHLPMFSSMPHATGRRGPLGETKVSLEEAASIREMVYIPAGISDSSLRTEHPSCFNGYGRILASLGENILPVGELRILSYVGKV